MLCVHSLHCPSHGWHARVCDGNGGSSSGLSVGGCFEKFLARNESELYVSNEQPERVRNTKDLGFFLLAFECIIAGLWRFGRRSTAQVGIGSYASEQSSLKRSGVEHYEYFLINTFPQHTKLSGIANDCFISSLSDY